MFKLFFTNIRSKMIAKNVLTINLIKNNHNLFFKQQLILELTYILYQIFFVSL